MGQRIPIPLGSGSYENTSKPFSAQRCVNMYVAAARDLSLNDTQLIGSPGISQFSTVGNEPSRGASVMGSLYYIVSGQKLYSVDEFGTVIDLGTITGTKRVSMANNGEKLCIVVPGGNSYVWNETTDTLAQITDVDFRVSDTVCFIDGFYVFTETDSKIFFNSALNDPLSFDGLDFGSAELAPDNNVTCHVNSDELYILGQWTTELFQNIGGSGFPFQRVQGASYEKGCHAKHSVIDWEDDFYFLGGGKNERTTVYKAGTTSDPKNISTDSIDLAIQKFDDGEIAEAFSFTYSINGFSFVGFTIRSVNITSRTFVYNITASEFLGRSIWFEQQTGISENAWGVQSVDFVFSKFLVSDINDGKIGVLDPDLYTEYGNVILALKTLPPFYGDSNPIFMDYLELTADAGQGLVIGQGSDPQVMLDFSDDGARTWSSEFWSPLGKIGEYFRRTVWRRLGRVPDHSIYRFKITDSFKRVLIKLSAGVTSGI